MKCIFNDYSNLHFHFLMISDVMKLKIIVFLGKRFLQKNSTGSLSNLLFLANPNELSWQSSLQSCHFFLASGSRQFLHIAFMVVARARLGDVLGNEPQTLQQSLNFSRCHYCICDSAIGDLMKRGQRECMHEVYCQHMYAKCTVSKASMHIVLCRHG